jgi:glycosyltransferase involved in cell wall biosynthesis
MQIGIVIIGRNEGDRLRQCLESLRSAKATIVYADSGSTDGSAQLARDLGAEVVEIDESRRFTAARGRNEGFRRLSEIAEAVQYVQFIDGDCDLAPNWLEHAVTALRNESDLAAICGLLRERHPQASVYNRLCDLQWNGPAGQIDACGGIAMYRVAAFREVGGFDPSVAAGEEPELCSRLRKAGWRILRLSQDMARHDAAMMSFGQWWQRSVRSGYGTADVFERFGVVGCGRQIRSARLWTVGWLFALCAAMGLGRALGGPGAAETLAALVFLAPFVQAIRLAARVHLVSADLRTAIMYGLLTMVAKWGQLIGHVRWGLDRRFGRGTSVTHKPPAGATVVATMPAGTKRF